jgi:phage shock protein A
MDNTRNDPSKKIKTVADCDQIISELSRRLKHKRIEKKTTEIRLNKMLAEHKAVTEGIAYLTAEIQLLEEKINASQESSANVVKLRKQLAQMKGDIASFRIKETMLDGPSIMRKSRDYSYLEGEVKLLESFLESITLRKQELEAQG